MIDLMGQRFGKLTVIGRAASTSDGQATWECQCDCGVSKPVLGKLLRNGKTSSCGCYRRQRQSQARKKDLKGKRFGLLEVIKDMGLNSHGNYTWLCRCDCGTFKTISSGQLLNKKRPTKSCGCLIGKSATERTLKDMKGQRYGRLVGVKRVPNKNSTTARWLFQCDCGNTTEADGSSVRYGDAQSCGCLKSETSRAWGLQIWRKHQKWEGPDAYAKDKRHAMRLSYVYLVRVADYYLKYGIAFDLQTRGKGDYQEILFAQQMTRAECWTVEQLALQATKRYSTSTAPADLKCKGFTEFRENLSDSVALATISSLCSRVQQEGWEALCKKLEAS